MVLATKSKNIKGCRSLVSVRYDKNEDSLITEVYKSDSDRFVIQREKVVKGKLPKLPKRFRKLLSDDDIQQIKAGLSSISDIGAKHGIY